MKKTAAILLCVIMIFASALPAFGAQEPAARLYNVYADDMLFQRDTDAVLAGEAPEGSTVTAELLNKTGAVAARGAATAAGGRFCVSFPAPAGGYDEYTVRVCCNGTAFAELRRVVFGELWLATGQSNMEYYLNKTPEGKAMEAAGETGPHDLHVLLLPAPYADGEYQTRYLPQTDAIICSWFTGDDAQVYRMSAAAYFFAVKLQQKLNMPVGVLSVPLGGSCIAPWLSRSAIDGNAAVKNHLIETGTYYGEERWSDPDRAMHMDMTNLYNTNIAPLTNFRPQGVLWYQGCSDLITDRTAEYYRDCFDLMQDSYTEDFCYAGDRLPFIFTQLAYFDYGMGPYKVTDFNEVFTDLAKADPASRAEITIYDLSLDYNEMGAIHPMTKKPIGERMFLAAEGLVYGASSPTSAAVCTGAQVKDGSVYLTFENVGDGLAFAGETPRGFTVCGEDGIAVEANAEIAAPDTVRVYSEYVPYPVAAAYAAGSWSERANLWSTCGGEPFMPAAPYGIRDRRFTRHYADNAWMNCEDLSFFAGSGPVVGYVNAWKLSGCGIALEGGDRAEGDAALRVTAKKASFTLSPNISDREKLKTVVYDNTDPCWDSYATLQLRVKNCGGTVLRLDQIRLYVNDVVYYTPVCNETGLLGFTVPADGAWHLVTFDLNRLKTVGAAGSSRAENKLSKVTQIKLRFEGANAELLLDDIRVLPESAAAGTQKYAFEGVMEYLKALFLALRDRLMAFFGRAAS